jgi:hypothetical protein
MRLKKIQASVAGSNWLERKLRNNGGRKIKSINIASQTNTYQLVRKLTPSEAVLIRFNVSQITDMAFLILGRSVGLIEWIVVRTCFFESKNFWLSEFSTKNWMMQQK